MTKGKKRKPYHPRSTKKNRDLDHVPETADTSASESKGADQSKKYDSQQSVAPQPSLQPKKFDLHKIIVIVGYIALGITILGPLFAIVWHSATLDTTVSILGEDVEDIQAKTDRLIESSIRTESRLESVDKSISEIRVEIGELGQQEIPENNED